MKMKTKQETSSESILHEELMEIDSSIYHDDLDFPFSMEEEEDQIRVAMAHYRDRSRHLSVFDAIGLPSISDFCGDTGPLHITDDDRLKLTPLCKLALDKYNAENQGANFVFVDLVKSTCALCSGISYYMTFQAKDATHPSKTPHIIFQAHVWDRVPRAGPPVVQSCAMKTT
ncbi:hypothetical protein TSUD_09080 [Trifolium subterraneum]|nr:hypothetical protein TSUD_09080 [Trifolium subterraneum]